MSRLRFRVPRNGYTLVELLLAVALLAMLAGITVPSALRMHADSRLSEVSEQVRLQVAGTRVRAIESGLVYQFRYEPDGRNYCSVPYEREFEGSNPNATGTGATTGVGRFTRFAGELAAGFQFAAAGNTENAIGGQLSEEVFGDLPNADKLSGVDWSPPILFVADGSAIDAAFEIVDGRGKLMQLTVRGLTGAAALGRMTERTEK